MSGQQTDEELVTSFQSTGAPADLEELARRHLRRVRNMLFHMVLNAADADDLAQEVMLRAFRGLPQFNGRARFSTWLHAIALNTARSFLASRARDPCVPGELPADASAPARLTAAALALGSELDVRITAGLATLSPKLRAALVLTVIHELDVAAVAAVERCTAATIYWRVFQAKRQLRKYLKDYLDE